MSQFLKDLRFGCRTLLKLPGFSALAILTLALGIGATSAFFSLIQGVLLTPPPYREPDQLLLNGVLFAAVALLACWVPARRAAMVDTLTALREA